MNDFQDIAESFAPDAGPALGDDLLVDVISLDGRILWLNDLQAERIGTYDREISGYDASAFYTPESFGEIEHLLRHRSRTEHATTLELTLLAPGGRPVRTLARARFVRFRGEMALRLAKMDYGPVGNRYKRLEDDFRMLNSVLETSSEAHWSIVFLEPVDTTLPRPEVVRQVFENQSVWRFCNQAMARVYQIPETVDFNEQEVRLYWPRSAVNEQFVEEIISSDYSINDALSVDRRHDGTLQYILNDVRAEIVDGFLLRLWGNCRDVTAQHNADDKRTDGFKLLIRTLDGLPDPVLLLDSTGRVAGRNQACASVFAESRTLEGQIVAHCRMRRAAFGWSLLSHANGTGGASLYDIHCRKIAGPDGESWSVLTIRERSGDKPPSGPKRLARQPMRRQA